jgi:hypothetical protein
MPVTGIATPANFSVHMISYLSQTRSGPRGAEQLALAGICATSARRSKQPATVGPNSPTTGPEVYARAFRSRSWRVGCRNPVPRRSAPGGIVGTVLAPMPCISALSPNVRRHSSPPSLRDYVLDSSSGSTVQIASKRTMPATSTSASVSTMRNARPLTATNTPLPPPTQTSGGGTGSRGKVPRSGASIKQPMA